MNKQFSVSNIIDPSDPVYGIRAGWLDTYQWLELVGDLARCKHYKDFNTNNEYTNGIINPNNDKLKVQDARIGYGNAKYKYVNDQTNKFSWDI